MTAEEFRYDDKVVLVVGGATGMGAAAAATVAGFGAELIVMDVQDVDYPVRQFVKVDLAQRDSVDAALGEVTGPVHAVFACAGVGDGTPGLPQINFIAHRHIVESLMADGKLAEQSSVAFVSSVAGIGWDSHLERALDYLATPDWDAATSWIDEHEGTDTYAFSKQAINAFVTSRCFEYRKRGVRLNAILPGPTDTPLARSNEDLWLSFGTQYRDQLGHGPMLPDQMGDTLAFLGSDAASGVVGQIITIDLGQVASHEAGSVPDPIMDMLKSW